MPLFFFFNDTATTEIYTLSLHDALPIYPALLSAPSSLSHAQGRGVVHLPVGVDRKSTRLNSSHVSISYAVFCLKKKIRTNTQAQLRPPGKPCHTELLRGEQATKNESKFH